ncbi:MAG TPA: hypothetical protein VG938_00075 [Verrucomicrobiae bacterium]|jgi:hypothetical protein|nr:hypothetical protein [Verrucomicrobiae bacterium]
MQFLKKNYEKIVLAVVAIAALGVVAFLPILVSHEKSKLDVLENTVVTRKPKPLPALDLTRDDALLQRAQKPMALNLAGPHKIFNPVRWQMKADRVIFPNPAGREIDMLEITKISPLDEVYSLESVSVTPGLPTHYGIGIRHEAAASAGARSVKITYVALNVTTNNFAVLSAEGPEEDPTSVKLLLTDTHQTVTIAKDQPFKRVEGYMADLRYPPENKDFRNRRKTDTSSVCFAGECYKIVDIEESEVVLLQLSNQKQWIKEFNPKNAASSAPAP